MLEKLKNSQERHIEVKSRERPSCQFSLVEKESAETVPHVDSFCSRETVYFIGFS